LNIQTAFPDNFNPRYRAKIPVSPIDSINENFLDEIDIQYSYGIMHEFIKFRNGIALAEDHTLLGLRFKARTNGRMLAVMDSFIY
jgi:hypothetical protein